MKIFLLLLILTGCYGEIVEATTVAVVDVPQDSCDVRVMVWKDSTGHEYLIAERTYGDHIAVAITYRLPAAPPAPAPAGVDPYAPFKDATYEYTSAPTTWVPKSGWERQEEVSQSHSRYRRRLDWLKNHLEAPEKP